MQKISINVTPQDLRQSARYNLDPLLYSLSRLTGTLWRIDEAGFFVELTAPYRVYESDRKLATPPKKSASATRINLLPKRIVGQYQLMLKGFGAPGKK